MTHPSNSKAQVVAQSVLLDAAEKLFRINKLDRDKRINLPGNNFVVVDGVSEQPPILIEVYARTLELHGAQPKKIAQDILKLAMVKRMASTDLSLGVWSDARLVILFASSKARDSVQGSWRGVAAEKLGVELRSADELPNSDEFLFDTRRSVEAAQKRQKMTNADQCSD